MNRLYLITAREGADIYYDLYNGFAIKAKNENNAWEIAKNIVSEDNCDWDYFTHKNFKIEEIDLNGNEEVIMARWGD